MNSYTTTTVAALFATVMSVTSANASPVNLAYDGLYHGNSGAEQVRVNTPVNDRVYADGFNMTGPAPISDFIAWCMDLFNPVRNSATYEPSTNGNLGSGEITDLNRLFTNNQPVALDNATNSAAFQVAIWEIVYDQNDDQSAYNVLDGNFKLQSASNDVINTANNWLRGLGDENADAGLQFFVSENAQDLVTTGGVTPQNPAPVPLPAGVLLLGTGLAALVLARRKSA